MCVNNLPKVDSTGRDSNMQPPGYKFGTLSFGTTKPHRSNKTLKIQLKGLVSSAVSFPEESEAKP